MTGMAGCREIKQALGVYVLGAIDPAERAQVDEHLSSCQECREELASLAGLPAMLRKVPIVEADSNPISAFLDSILGGVENFAPPDCALPVYDFTHGLLESARSGRDVPLGY